MFNDRIAKMCSYVVFLLFLSTVGFIQFADFAEAQDKPIVLKMGHVAPPFAHGAKYGMEPWAKNIEKATNGRVKITLYPAQSLFKARDGVNAVESGIADIAQLPIGYFTGRFNLIEVITLPFLTSNPTSEYATRLIYDLYKEFPEMRKDFSSMKVLMLGPGDPYLVMTKDKPVVVTDDLNGMKIRVIGKWPSKALQSLGASTVMIPMPEIYESAAKGVIDGGLIFNTMALDLRMYEVFNYCNTTPIYNSISVVVMNLDKWKSLPPDIQQQIDSMEYNEAISWAKTGYDATKDKIGAAAKKAEKKWELVTFNKTEYELMKAKIGRPIWDEWVNEMEKRGLPGRKVLNRTLELIEAYNRGQ